ncbi:MAG: di-trans,poly-cis-decaprenylcistransferase [Burkholderia sp.]|jgi:undecaprenyl diphosphate synthase|uniref:Isoprenyl transferase n=3 Tax=Burkholderia TaxID=32008 RepID=A0A833PJZ3_BURL3|nr:MULTISPECIES: polyprenyl diphosphate synthase [Burkholderia]ABB08919.1 Undecaprenyl pyrophosphate synthetase [Burkholderia lata]KAF1034091.1 MAG: Ditrans,polycis-undecaprenyl-diphosphate synthase ((2E,6E)-farnesyl-diphosphate specific) [Burkholderia lata]MBY8607309.1 di-trans,poly-cis-decaprenylcistransferase [Burkholderia arboris]MCA3777144.1 di-trans,poly-cis-decaprenylcistransferase [Burkholderia sp.]MCA3797885.1 di-trans,poly-cis-decaprenylcistransferase [Burkholderia sp.]
MTYTSSTVRVPDVGVVPRHIAIIMDGNGRWATERRLPRVAGHTRGVDAVRAVVEGCARAGVEYLTLFAFSSENWRRPNDEVSFLMRLFITALEREVGKLHANGIRLRVVGDLDRFEPRIRELIRRAETKTARNTRLTLTIAANYGGRWDILQATKKLIEQAVREGREVEVTEDAFAPHLAMAYAPEPDLFIRTGGEQRVSNFLLWQLAYAEFYFTDKYWPDFDGAALADAMASYTERERRFGRTSAQLEPQSQNADSLSC